MAILVWTLGALTWSAFANLVVGDLGYVPRNLLLAACLVLLARRLGRHPRALGLGADSARNGLIAGIGSVVLVALVLLVAVAFADHVGFVQALLGDRRAELATGSLAFTVLVRIPIGTVLFEEVLFRGLGLALRLERMQRIPAVLVNSAVFGLWHVPPTIVGLRLNDIDPGSTVGLASLAGAILATFLAGTIFAWLRLWTGSLLAPVIAHWATNALGILAAVSQ